MCDVIPGHFQSMSQVILFKRNRLKTFRYHITHLIALTENDAVETVFTNTNVKLGLQNDHLSSKY